MIDTEKALEDYTITCERYMITDDKKNTRDAYLQHLMESYAAEDYNKLIDVIGIEYISLPSDNQGHFAELTIDVLASLLFACKDYDGLRELVEDKPLTSLIGLLLSSAELCEEEPSYHREFMECFGYSTDKAIDKEGYINA